MAHFIAKLSNPGVSFEIPIGDCDQITAERALTRLWNEMAAHQPGRGWKAELLDVDSNRHLLTIDDGDEDEGTFAGISAPFVVGPQGPVGVQGLAGIPYSPVTNIKEE